MEASGETSVVCEVTDRIALCRDRQASPGYEIWVALRRGTVCNETLRHQPRPCLGQGDEEGERIWPEVVTGPVALVIHALRMEQRVVLGRVRSEEPEQLDSQRRDGKSNGLSAWRD